MSQYTKGTWLNRKVLIESKVMDNAYKSIALIVPTGNNEEEIANADLIAAAPTMYEACQSAYKLLFEQYEIVLGHYPKFGKYPEIEQLEQALAKAEGK